MSEDPPLALEKVIAQVRQQTRRLGTCRFGPTFRSRLTEQAPQPLHNPYATLLRSAFDPFAAARGYEPELLVPAQTAHADRNLDR